VILARAVRLLPVLAVAVAGCFGGADSEPRMTSSALPPAGASAYRLPWACGRLYVTTQGNHGDICGTLGNHVGVEEYAFDFGLPLRTPVVAARAGVVTLAATYSPPGSACHDGCPYTRGSTEYESCCTACIYSANRVNVEHSDGAISTYSHFDELAVTEGQKVAPGDLLGWSGTSGCSTGAHLHFQIMRGCPSGYCQSLAVAFDEAGVPGCGDKAISQNECL
jgi:murein DD-endopeptidase MepM/ murein hydrolase activator NlpD